MSGIIPPKIFGPLMSSIGELVTQWTLAETSLDQWVNIIYRKAGGHHLDNQMPVALKRKIKFLRRCFRQIEALAPYAEEAIPLLATVSELSDTRHTVSHGYIADYHLATGIVTFRRVIVDGDTHRYETESLTIGRILDAGEDSRIVAGHLTDLTERLLTAFMPQNR